MRNLTTAENLMLAQASSSGKYTDEELKRFKDAILASEPNQYKIDFNQEPANVLPKKDTRPTNYIESIASKPEDRQKAYEVMDRYKQKKEMQNSILPQAPSGEDMDAAYKELMEAEVPVKQPRFNKLMK